MPAGGSIRSRFIRYALIIILPLLIVSVIVLTQYYVDKRADITASSLAQVRSAASLTNLWITDQMDSLQAISVTRAVRERDLPVLSVYFVRLIEGRQDWQNIFVTDAAGVLQQGYAPFSPGDSVADREYFIEARRTGQPRISNLIVSGRFVGRPAIVIAYPLTDEEGNFDGIIGLSLPPEGLSGIYSRLMLPEQYVIAVYDRNSALISRNTAFEENIGRRFEAEAISGGLAGRTGVVTETSPVDGVVRFLAYTQVPDAGWAMITGAPEETVFGTFRRTLVLFIVFAVLLTGLTLFLAGYLARLFAWPIIYIGRSAAAIGAGQLDTRVELHTGDELEDLGCELNRMAAELEGAAAARADFLSRVSHELRSPLTAMRSFLDLAAAGKLGAIEAERLRDGLTIARRQSVKLQQVIEDLIALSDLEAGRVVLNRDSVDPAVLINDVIDLMRPVAEAGGLYLLGRVEGPLPSIYGDVKWLTAILQKIIDNAVKFTAAGGVQVSAAADNGYLHINVEDTGQGIETDKLEHIFERFYQVEEVTSRRAPGSGLGLPIARLVIEMHGGRIEAESRGPGQGAVFRILLPLEVQ